MNLDLYKNLISETSKNYKFCKINKELNQDDLVNGNENICFLRHDIDYSPSNALKIAELEADQEIFSTFTVLSLFTNLAIADCISTPYAGCLCMVPSFSHIVTSYFK